MLVGTDERMWVQWEITSGVGYDGFDVEFRFGLTFTTETWVVIEAIMPAEYAGRGEPCSITFGVRIRHIHKLERTTLTHWVF